MVDIGRNGTEPDRAVAIVTTSQGVMGTWTDAPLLFSVLAPNLPTLRAVIEAVVASG